MQDWVCGLQQYKAKSARLRLRSDKERKGRTKTHHHHQTSPRNVINHRQEFKIRPRWDFLPTRARHLRPQRVPVHQQNETSRQLSDHNVIPTPRAQELTSPLNPAEKGRGRFLLEVRVVELVLLQWEFGFEEWWASLCQSFGAGCYSGVGAFDRIDHSYWKENVTNQSS